MFPKKERSAERRRRRPRLFLGARAINEGEEGAKIARRRRGVYLLPNLFTTAALFFGFFGIVQAMGGRFADASIAIFVAMVLDSMDGRIARMTNTQSEFGAEYDSLADMVSFGAAPALIIYEWALKGLGNLGWLAAFVYLAGAALRLARFNTNIGVVDKRYFQGLPSPAAAALIVGLVWVSTDLHQAGWIDWGRQDLRWVAWGLAIFAGLTMVSNVPFYSFKDFNPRRNVPFIAVFLAALAVGVISQEPPLMLFLVFLCYAGSGYVLYVVRRTKGEKLAVFADPTDKPESTKTPKAPPGDA